MDGHDVSDATSQEIGVVIRGYDGTDKGATGESTGESTGVSTGADIRAGRLGMVCTLQVRAVALSTSSNAKLHGR